MKATVEAVFENGVFKPVSRPQIPEGERVRITVERLGQPTPDEILQLATHVYAGLSPGDVEDIEEMARRRALFTREPA